jgi:hypothetical protein
MDGQLTVFLFWNIEEYFSLIAGIYFQFLRFE